MTDTAPSREDRLRRLKFRAWHRGTREADYMMGCYFDRFHADWDDDQIVWFERLLKEEDVDVLDWVLGTRPIPDEYLGPMMTALQKLDFVEIPN